VAIRREGLDSVSVDADSGQIRQVVWNLVRNAIQASASGQCVTVKLENRDTVKLSVEDQGLGISKESADQLFDAFYTTRSHGTGLGLAVVKRIVDEHGFSIDVQSGTERGACFVVDFGPQARLRPG
jgi:signal transduction histidine kinase